MDVEFAHDGEGPLSAPVPAPEPVRRSGARADSPGHPRAATSFSRADRYVSNGRIADINHIVYVDPERYADLASRAELKCRGPGRGRTEQAAAQEDSSSSWGRAAGAAAATSSWA